MLFYLFVGIFTSLLAHIAISNYDRNKILFYVSFPLLILFPSIIEGCRDWNLGSDMLGYGSIYFYDSLHYNNVGTFLSNLDTKEYGYHLLCYFCGKVGSINLYMFMAALIKMTMLALTCLHFRKITIPWMVVLGYMLFFYWYGFSLMRQSLAMSICMYSLVFLYEKQYIKYLLFVFIGYSFHNSSIFILFLPFVILVSKMKHRLLIVTFGVGTVYVLASTFFMFIATSGLFGEEKADLYLDSGVASAKTNIVILIAFYLAPYLHKNIDSNIKYYVQACSLIALMFLFLSGLFEVAFRVSFYQMVPLLFLIPALLKLIKDKSIQLIGIIIYVCLFFLHIVIAANHGMADTIPYRSIILENLL